MANKKSLTNGVSLKVENRSGFDKSRFNALTTGVGTLTPLAKQLLIPSSGKLRLKISAQLPPLASDAYLRSHLKVEAFAVPLRLCYGGFESWYCGREVYDAYNDAFGRAKLPFVALFGSADVADNEHTSLAQDFHNEYEFAPSSSNPDTVLAGGLYDYLGVNFYKDEYLACTAPKSKDTYIATLANGVNNEDIDVDVTPCNFFPFMCYSLIYDEYYRNKLVERPLFGPPASRPSQDYEFESPKLRLANLPYISSLSKIGILPFTRDFASDNHVSDPSGNYITSDLIHGSLFQLRQRNYGDDYFTAATPSLQEGSPAQVDTSAGYFTIAALRAESSMQRFRELNNYASPDYIQTNVARYGVAPSAGVAQKPILLGSADFPMYTSGVEQTAQSASQSVNTPFNTVGSRYGRAHAEGSDFVCDFDVKEPAYLMVIVSLVPEATYSQGFDRDMQLFVTDGDLVDLPCAIFENIGNEPIYLNEIASVYSSVFGYVQRYLWHKLGHQNEVHGLFKAGESLESFVVQRGFASGPSLSKQFLQVKTTDLDNVAAVSSGISQFGVMIDSRVELFVSEPLSESSIPSLADPDSEHGHSVYVKTGGSKLA